MEIVAYRAELVDAVRDFNARLRNGGVVLFQFPESHTSLELPKRGGLEIYEEYFVAVDNEAVRGGYILKHQPFWIKGQIMQIGYLTLPLSEGIINKAYRRVGIDLFVDATKRQPLQYGLGMGSMEAPFVKIMLALGARARSVPFYFRVVRPARFLHQCTYLRTSPLRRGLLDTLAVSGIGGVAIKLVQASQRRSSASKGRLDVDVVGEFDDWCETVWARCKTDYVMAAVRDGAALRTFYPKGDRYIRLKVSRAGNPIGWTVLLATQMSGNKFFGDMKVGTIVDCLAQQQDAKAIIGAATEYLEHAGVDVIVSNQSAVAWGRALQESGYLRGTSNFVFTASKELTPLLEPLDETFDHIHLTRGDGEGPGTL